MYEVGDIFETNHCGNLKIIEKTANKFYRLCRFEDGTIVKAQISNIKRGCVRNPTTVNYIDKTFKQKEGTLKIIEKSEITGSYIVEFEEIEGFKYRTTSQMSQIKKGNVRNLYFKSFYGVGYLGEYGLRKNKYIYSKWSGMLSRCYNDKSPNYKTYGAIGIRVCDRWHCFSDFLKDFRSIEGYNGLSGQSLDKDIKQSNIPHNKKIYSLETCMLVTQKENSKEQNERNRQYYFTATHVKTGYKEVANNQGEFAKKFNIDRRKISSVLSKKRNSHKGWIFHKSTESEIKNKDLIKLTDIQKEEILKKSKENKNVYTKTLAKRLSDGYEEVINGNVKEFCERFNLKKHDIDNNLRGKNKNSKGWVFVRLEHDSRIYRNQSDRKIKLGGSPSSI